ncbi:MAG: MFS transporter [Candidatus Gracilibacteria bacterium]|jgi:multidrug resistance protein
MKIQKEKLLIILTVFIDVVGMGIIIPVMPFYVKSFGASDFTVTLLFSVFSLCAFLSSPLLGAISDKFGRRPVLMASIFSTAIGWLVFAAAGNITMLFLGRIIDGIAAGNFSTAQSYLSDIAKDDKERTSNLGLMGAVFGVAFIIGPAVGGVLSQISHAFPFWIVGILAIFNTIGIYFFLPESHKHLKKDATISINPIKPLLNAVKDKKLTSRYISWFLFGIAVAIHQSIFALYLYAVFKIDSTGTGTIFTIMGAVMILNQGFLLKNFWLKRFKESSLEVWLFLVGAIGFTVIGIGISWIFVIGLAVMALSQSVLRVVVSSRVSGIAGVEKRGETLGIMASVLSLSMIVGPLLGGALFSYNTGLPFFVAGVAMFLAFLIMNFSKKFSENKFDKELPVAEAL